MEQEGSRLVTVHEVGTILWVVIVIKMLVAGYIHDLHFRGHERIFVIVGRQANEAVEFLLLASVIGFFKEYIMQSLVSCF